MSGIVFSVVAAAAGAFVTIKSGWIPANADARPGWLETYAARNSLRATLVAEAPQGPNPVQETDAALIEGVNLYGTHCAVRHGSSKGDSAMSAIARGEYPKPPQLATHGVEDDPEGWTFWKIKYGIRRTGMPSWKYELDDGQTWALALFLKHMDKLPPAAEAAWRALPDPTPPAGDRGTTRASSSADGKG